MSGMDEAVDAACAAFYREWAPATDPTEDFPPPDDSATCRREMTRALDAARPFIAAAVRVDVLREERAKVLAEVDAVMCVVVSRWHSEGLGLSAVLAIERLRTSVRALVAGVDG